MRIFMVVLALLFVLPAADLYAMGGDEFGSRFTGRVPSALEIPTLEQRLQDIAPAAGAEAPSTTASEKSEDESTPEALEESSAVELEEANEASPDLKFDQ